MEVVIKWPPPLPGAGMCGLAGSALVVSCHALLEGTRYYIWNVYPGLDPTSTPRVRSQGIYPSPVMSMSGSSPGCGVRTNRISPPHGISVRGDLRSIGPQWGSLGGPLSISRKGCSIWNRWRKPRCIRVHLAFNGKWRLRAASAATRYWAIVSWGTFLCLNRGQIFPLMG